ncbi:alpha/beta fold hydrolase [Undibacterium sp. TJN25]|uniref:alpha/beta fold hydrolase n=1 Tax=Undibacterium sp. TJN25 TaxID=3413056 RepID=UPI003BF2B3EA
MKKLTIKKFLNGHLAHYVVDGNGPWIVLIHPLATDLTVWTPHVRQLSKHYRVLRYDIRGHGKSSSHAPLNANSYSLELLAGDLRALMDELGIDSAHIVGIALGGLIGRQLSLSTPERLQSLTLVGSLNAQAHSPAENWNRWITLAEHHGLDGVADEILASYFTAAFRSGHSGTMARISRLIRGTSQAGFIRACSAIRSIDLAARLERVRLPSLMVAGEMDPVAQAAEKTFARLSGAEFVCLPNASQCAALEQESAFLACLERFLQRVSAPAAFEPVNI